MGGCLSYSLGSGSADGFPFSAQRDRFFPLGNYGTLNLDRQRTRIWTTLYLHMYTIFVETLIIFRLRLHPAPFRASTQFIDGSLWNSLRPGNGFWTIKLWIPFCLLYRTVTRSIFLLDRHLAGITSFLPRLTRLSTLFCHIKLD